VQGVAGDSSAGFHATPHGTRPEGSLAPVSEAHRGVRPRPAGYRNPGSGRDHSSTKLTSSVTDHAVIWPSLASTFCSFTHAPLTWRSVCAARAMPVATASSKLVSERTVMVVTLATDDMVFLLEQRGFLQAHGPPFDRAARGVDGGMPRAFPSGPRGGTASDDSVNHRRTGPFSSSWGRAGTHAGVVKVALLAESFLPHMNGVTHPLLQVLRHLERRGHEAFVVAPRSGPIDQSLFGARTVLLPSVPLPSYPDVRVTLASAHRLTSVLRDHGAEVMHLASPFVLGWRGLAAAEALALPSVAVYQTDIPSYAERYGVPGAAPALTRHLGRLHRRATLTLAPSSSAIERLQAGGGGDDTVRAWAGGVDTERFAPGRRSERWRRTVAEPGEVIVGYVGRLAPEKQVEDL